jgi:hypothetical protein
MKAYFLGEEPLNVNNQVNSALSQHSSLELQGYLIPITTQVLMNKISNLLSYYNQIDLKPILDTFHY